MRKVNLILAAILAAALAAGGLNANTARKSRRIQADGLLLEWRGAEPNAWPGDSKWLWDAVSTVDGVAGYVSLPGIDIEQRHYGLDPEWQFTLRAANTGRTIEIKLPGQPSGDFFAFDKVAFETDGSLTAEWIIPWDFFDDDSDADMYELFIYAVSARADTLPPVIMSIPAPRSPQAPSGLLTRLILIALTAVLTVALIIIRRRQRKIPKKDYFPKF